MRYLIISDIHGSFDAIKKIENIINENEIDKIICLGDVLYHGPRNDLPKDYSPKKVVIALKKYLEKIIFIKGNCDAEVDEMISEFEFKDNIELNINGKKFFFTHGQKYNMENIPKEINVLVYGHFHTGFIKEKDGVICVNSGSISLPKNNTKNSYLIIENNKIVLKDVEGNIISKKDI